MDRQDNKIKSIKHICAGLLAHVDAGKTTLSEDILYHTGVIRKPGRVDHRDTFFDTDSRERKRGITIFSKEASFKLGDKCFYLMDTPGHTDFSAEMERVLSVLDYAVLIISGPDGVQSHTRTLWRLLKRYELPALIFVNKMDMEGTDKSSIMKELRSELSESCVEFSKELINGYAAEGAFIKEAGAESAAIPEELLESIAMSSEELMEEYLEKGSISSASIIKAIKGRELYPCIFGSALRDEGVSELLSALAAFTDEMDFGDEFSARVFKITRDQRGNRLTHMKLTGGSIRVKDSIDIPAGSRKAGSGASEDPSAEDGSDSAETVSEKIEGIRLYNGERATELTEASAGMVVAISGLKHTYAGMGLGRTENDEKPLLVPLFEYALIPPFDVDRKQFYLMLKPLEDEIPELLLSYIPSNDEIHIRLMGDVQNEILTDLIEERYGVKVEFGEASVIYKETIADSVEGVGHFEPLRHYAEAHLLLEPGEPGSGIEAVDLMGEGRGLSGNYRRLILSHILEKEHLGVLTGSGLTDVRISLVAGKSHDKHTEGGDFREATYRAIRQGLMYAENVLLEPYYEYRIKLPSEYVGRAMTDIQRMSGSFEMETLSDRESLVTGKAPVSLMKNYNAELISYTKGLGSLSLSFCGYGKCHDSEAAIESMGYDPESDVENPTGSVFCAHGAGYYVPWNEVYDMMHLPFATDVMRKRGISSSSYESNADDPISSDVIAGAHYAGTSGTDADASAAGGSGASGRASMSSRSSGGQGSSRDGAGGYLSQGYENDKELMGIFRRTFGLTKSERYTDKEDDDALLRSQGSGSKKKWGRGGTGKGKAADPREATAPDFVDIKDRKKSYLLVDGYNIIFAWDELKELSQINLDSARLLLMDILSNYQGYKGMNLILVFDAYRVKRGQRKIERYHNIYVVYTEEAETADKYIEKTVHDMDKKHDVTVATSDGLEQIIVFGEGAARLSARELCEEVMAASSDMRDRFLERRTKLWNTVLKEDKKDQDKNQGKSKK